MRIRRPLVALATLLAGLGLMAAPAHAVSDFAVVATINATFGSSIVTSGNYAYVASDSAITVIDATSNTVAATVPTSGATGPQGSVAVGGKVYFAARTSGKLIILDTATRAVSYFATTGCTNPTRLLAVGTSRIVATCEGSGGAQVIDVAGPSIAATLSTGSGPRGMSTDGQYVYVPNSQANSVSFINATAATPTVTATVSVGSQPEFTAYYSGQVYVVNFAANSVSIISTATNSVVATVAVGGNPQGVNSCQDNVYTANRWTGNTSVISPTSNAVSQTISLEPTGAITHVMGVSAGYAYFLNNSTDNVDVVNCSTTSKVATVATTAGPSAIAFTDRYAYVTGVNQITVFALPFTAIVEDVSQRPPDWMQQVARPEGGTCATGWNPSWAQWPNGSTGGYVCVQVLTWSHRDQGFVIQS